MRGWEEAEEGIRGVLGTRFVRWTELKSLAFGSLWFGHRRFKYLVEVRSKSSPGQNGFLCNARRTF